jgi:hypothetical protein
LITDHGNRGVDHFVKQICWTLYVDGNFCLSHFNLDIDKGGHSTIDAANAIYKSLNSLHLDDMDVEFSYICGDSGDGAKVQLLHPRLIELELMNESSDFVNCILHAFNLSYEHACKDSLGDQGMHKCTVFQMCYLAVLLMKKVKEQTNFDTLKKIYAKTMTQALTDQRYKDGAKVNFMQAYDELFDLLKESSDEEDAMESLERDLDIEQVLQEPDAAAINKLAEKCPTNIKEPNFSRWGTISAVCKVVLTSVRDTYCHS